MSTALRSNSTQFQNGMNIHLSSFIIPKNIISEKDEIRVSFTTIPEQKKDYFILEGKKMYDTHHVFTLNITNETRKILIVFRKKSIFSNSPIIASTGFLLNDFNNVPKEQITFGMINTDAKTVHIYYPFQKQMAEEGASRVERKVLGEMQVQLTFSAPFGNYQEQIKLNKVSKVRNSKKQERKVGYGKLTDENEICNSFLL